MKTRLYLPLIAILATLQPLGALAQTSVQGPIALSNIPIQLPEGSWRLLRRAPTADSPPQSIDVVQLDPIDSNRIRAFFRIAVLRPKAGEELDPEADVCLSRVLRLTRGLPNFENTRKSAERNDCRTTQPGNQYTTDWFEKEGGELKDATDKAGLRFVEGGVAGVTVSSAFGVKNRLSIVGYVGTGPSGRTAATLPSPHTMKELNAFANVLSKASRAVLDFDAPTMQFPSPASIGR